MIPWFERAIIYDVRARPNVIQSTSGSRDLQMVSSRVRSPGQPAGCCHLRQAVHHSCVCPFEPGLHMQVNIGLRVLTRPIPAQLPEIYRTLGTDYAERVLPSIIQVCCPHHRQHCLRGSMLLITIC